MQNKISKPYTQYSLTAFLSCLTGLACLSTVLYLLWISNLSNWSTNLNNAQISFISVLLAFVAIEFTLYKLKGIAKQRSIKNIFNVTICYYLIIAAILLVFRLQYSLYLLATGCILTLIIVLIEYIFNRNKYNSTYLVLDAISMQRLQEINSIKCIKVSKPILPDTKMNGIVVNLENTNLSKEWIKFITDCALQNIPIYDFNVLYEQLTGRIALETLSTKELSSLEPCLIYIKLKYILDLLIVLCTLPLILPILLITMLAIKLEDGKQVIYTQYRVGYKNKVFKIYKLRSMSVDSEKEGAQFAQQGDARVTKVGRFIRKTRIDELPQLFNVIKGDMALIGPRPEQSAFVHKLNKEIPFYNYRHMVKPGISGWAQVTQGYAADADETKIKLEHDLYYIKEVSLWLDIYIIFKTIHTIFTGFGSR